MNEGNTAFSAVVPAPLTRADALAAWGTFLARVQEYAARRNHVESGHDLAPELGPLAEFAPNAVAAFTSERTYREHYRLGENRIHALRTVLADGIARAAAHYRCPAALTDADDTAASIVAWARSQQLTEVVAFAPTVGPVRDLVPHLSKQIAERGIPLTLIQRPSDAHAFALASAGFFAFWEKMSRHLRCADSAAP